MNKLILMTATILLGTLLGHSQGTFLAYNGGPPTRIGSADGPLANGDFYGQFLVGGTSDTLVPIFISMPHYNGHVGGVIEVAVPGIPCREYAYIQMVAWDTRYWGTELENVPQDQLGRTDIVLKGLSGCDMDPVSGPRFTQPAIVPPIPEPSAGVLGLLGGSLVFAGRSVRRRQRRA